MATNAYIRTLRDGRFQSLEIDKLSDEELDFLSKRFPDDGWKWALFLAKWIRDNTILLELDQPR